MRGRKALNKLIASKDDYQRQPDERPRILPSEYRHGDRKKIEIRKEFQWKANSPSELSLGIVKTERRKAARLHVARPVTIDPIKQPFVLSFRREYVGERTRGKGMCSYVRALPPMVWLSTLQILARAGLATRHGCPSKSSCSRNSETAV